MFKPLPDVSAFRSGVNTKLKQIIQKMTAKRPMDRFKNDDEIIEAITNALKLQTTDSLDVERLASLGNMVMQQATTAKLQAQKEAEETDEWIKSLNIHITELFNKVCNKVNAINEHFETGKIVIQQPNDNAHDTNRSLRLIFNAKGVKINFSKYNSVEQHEKKHYENSTNFQKQHYQMVLRTPEKTYLGKNNFVLVGLAETTFKIGPTEYGFNLLLKIEPNEMYGEWYKMVFSKNIQPAEPSFEIDLSVFFTEYEKLMRNPLHTVKIDKLNDSDITNLLQMMMM